MNNVAGALKAGSTGSISKILAWPALIDGRWTIEGNRWRPAVVNGMLNPNLNLNRLLA
jgi:hypothetical protein